MKRFLLLSAILFCAVSGTKAQSYMNEWIDFSKTYYKFNVGASGLYRISQAQLTSLGIAGADATHFQLWRNGQMVPLYTSVQSGAIPAGGYIEFWGEMANGEWEKRLYLEENYQINNKWSLFSDTAAYFLTVNPAGNNNHYVPTANNTGSPLPQEPYFIHKAGVYYKQFLNPGFGAVVGSTVYSSSFDNGEGFTSGNINPASNFTSTLPNLYVALTGPNAFMNFSAVGRAINTRGIGISINNTSVGSFPMDYFNSLKETVNNIPLSLLSGASTTVKFTNTSTEPTDRMVMGMFEINYPRLFNFGGQNKFEFEMPASAAGNNLVITNFNHTGSAPLLYDITNRLRIVTTILPGGDVKVVLPPSATARKLVLVVDNSGVLSAGGFTTRNFINFSLTANQGNYLIISNPLLYNDGSGVNQVDEYRKYRASASGGGFNAKIYNIQDILDQFGWGIKNNAFAIKNFLRYARSVFTAKPSNCFIIGKGVNYVPFRGIDSNVIHPVFPVINNLNLVPVYGDPASDVLLASDEGTMTPKTDIGRLNVVNPAEIKNYLDKVKQYESYYNTVSCNIDDEIWKKTFIHVAGANDFLGEQILFYLNQYGNVVKDTLVGGDMITLQKSTVATVQTIANEKINKAFSNGFQLLTYFGHSSPTTLEYNLDNPNSYTFNGKYPLFLVNGCQAGNLFLADPSRLAGNQIISEKWVLSPQRGSVAYIASTHLGIVNYLHLHSEEFYNQIAQRSYGKSVGEVMRNVVDTLERLYTINDFYVRMHAEEIALHGDPAIKFYSFAKPDFAIEQSMIKIAPEFISIAETSFKAIVTLANKGRATNDSLKVVITRERPDGSKTIVYDSRIKGLRFKDSITLELPINPFTDKGLNKLKVEIDPDGRFDEICETNNSVTKEFFIFEDELRPAYPYNYSIINKQNITYYASTANPLGTLRKYYFEIDTTANFNSTSLRSDSLSSVGGSIAFKPGGITFTDSTVYYWRVGMRPQPGSPVLWNNFSFVYIPNSTGFNQSHYFQHAQSQFKNIYIDSASRRFNFDSVISRLQVRTGIFPHHTSPSLDVSVNLTFIERYGCYYGCFQFYVFNGKTLKPWVNFAQSNGMGMYGSWRPDCNGNYGRKFFEYYYYDQSYRKAAMDFMDSIPDGSLVVVTNLGAVTYPTFNANMLKADTATFGQGKSLYHKLKNAGFTNIDSFTHMKPVLFAYKKNDPSFTPVQLVGETTEQLVYVSEIPTYSTSGSVESPWYGPAKSWNQLKWDGKDIGSHATDSTTIDIIGKTTVGNEIKLATIVNAKDTSLNFISPYSFPYIKLRLNNTDEAGITPYQLKHWRVLADFVPEGAVAPNIIFRFKDTLELGEPLDFALAFRNISETAFDSLKLKMVVTDRNNVPKTIDLPKKKPLAAGDSIVVSYRLDTKDLAGLNTLYLMVNPDQDQPEQHLFNNFIYKSFFVRPDNFQPWLDVTFDGTHILNRDIVSAKPHILIKLKDDSRFLALSDTSGIKIKVRFPDNSVRDYVPNSDSVRFTPANLSNNENTAIVDLYPFFREDGDYELIVTGTDASGNKAGELEYKVGFQVINKPMISSLLNYPNPFTTSTAFVFTITGSEVPQNIRIQILTITGKVVREITKNELGPLRIGRNITEFKWDGTDQYGNKLGNGVYLYRVITNHNGKSLEQYKSQDDNTDKYFNKGYGKMYLMR
jgi:hypothetical protein